MALFADLSNHARSFSGLQTVFGLVKRRTDLLSSACCATDPMCLPADVSEKSNHRLVWQLNNCVRPIVFGTSGISDVTSVITPSF